MSLQVLHCIPSLGGGGAERQLSCLAQEMAKRGANIHLAYIHDGPNSAPLQNGAVKLHRISCAGNHDPRILIALIKLARTITPDLIHTWLPQMDVLGSLTARAGGVPHVISERSCEAAYAPGWKNTLRLRLGMNAAAVIANSAGGMQYWRTRGYRGWARVIPNGLPLETIRGDRFAQRPAELSLAREWIVYAGRLSIEKNVLITVTALLDVLRRRPQAAALVFGEGPLMNEIVALKHAAGQSSARLLLRGYSNDVWKWLHCADAFVSASAFEGNPNAVLEAAAIGCPLVLSDIPAHRELFDDSAARLVAAQSAETLIHAIVETLDRPEEARMRARKARAITDAFELSRIATTYIEYYKELVHAWRTRSRLR